MSIRLTFLDAGFFLLLADDRFALDLPVQTLARTVGGTMVDGNMNVCASSIEEGAETDDCTLWPPIILLPWEGMTDGIAMDETGCC